MVADARAGVLCFRGLHVSVMLTVMVVDVRVCACVCGGVSTVVVDRHAQENTFPRHRSSFGVEWMQLDIQPGEVASLAL